MKLVTLIQQLETLSPCEWEKRTRRSSAQHWRQSIFFSISYNPTFLTCCVSGRRLFSFWEAVAIFDDCPPYISLVSFHKCDINTSWRVGRFFVTAVNVAPPPGKKKNGRTKPLRRRRRPVVGFGRRRRDPSNFFFVCFSACVFSSRAKPVTKFLRISF